MTHPLLKGGLSFLVEIQEKESLIKVRMIWGYSHYFPTHFKLLQ